MSQVAADPFEVLLVMEAAAFVALLLVDAAAFDAMALVEVDLPADTVPVVALPIAGPLVEVVTVAPEDDVAVTRPVARVLETDAAVTVATEADVVLVAVVVPSPDPDMD